MGCWNETCGFSQQTIRAGEDVYAVIILNNTQVGKSCYGDGVAKPMSFVIEAKYNDYGSIQDVVDNFASQSTIKLFNEYLKEDKLNLTPDFIKEMKQNQGDSYYESGYDAEKNEFTDLTTIFYGIERGYITLEHSSYDGVKTHSLYFVLMGKDTLESAWESLNYSTDYETENDSWLVCKDDVQTLFDTFTDTATMDKYEIRLALKEEGISPEREDELYEMLLGSSITGPWGGDSLKSQHSDWGNSVRAFQSYEGVERHSFTKLYKIVKESDLSEDVNKALSTMLMTMKAFMAYRKSWAPQGHSSQHDSFDLVLDFTERQLRKMYKKRQDMADDGYYEDGFPEVIGAIPIFEEGKIKCDS